MNTTETEGKIAELLAAHGVTMAATFVPQSMSRNSLAKEKTLNWRVTFASKRGAFTLDYQQGIGHVPGYRQPRTVYDQQRIGEPWETGRYTPARGPEWYSKRLPAPTAADILHCIVLDSSAADDSFEQWALELGYDTDSRAAERIYQTCRQQSADARRVLGREVLEAAAVILEDY